jgi:hypothetical protein
MGAGGSLDEIVGQIDVLSGRLEFLEVSVSDDEKLAVLLLSVPSKFDAVSAVFELQDETEMTFVGAVQKMKDFEGRYEARVDHGDNRALKVEKKERESQVFLMRRGWTLCEGLPKQKSQVCFK